MLQRRVLILIGIGILAGFLGLVIYSDFFKPPKNELRIFYSSEISGYVRPCG